MQRHKWAVIGLAAAIGLVGLLGFASWRIGRPAAVAKQLWKETIPIGGGRLGSHPSNTVAVAISSDGHFFLAAPKTARSGAGRSKGTTTSSKDFTS